MEGSLNARSELFDELHPLAADLPPRPHTVMSGSLQSSSFRIIDHNLRGNVNPSPVSPSSLQSNGSHSVVGAGKDQFLSPSRLREVSGVDDLSQITYIELSLNTSTTSVGNFGAYLPRLLQLSLSRSVVHSIRDLGTSLCSLRVLWIANCSLKDLDGLAALPNIQELYVANNKISDVSLISLLSELEVLDLENNLLLDSDQLGYLCLCQNLTILNLANNPVVRTLSESDAYRETIRDTIPQLKILDEIPFDGVDVSSLRSVSSYSLVSPSIVNDWRDVNKGFISPNTAQEKELARTKLPSRPHSAIVSTRSSNSSKAVTEDSSELTHGLNQVICGNPIRALRERRNRLLSSQSTVITSTLNDGKNDSPLTMREGDSLRSDQLSAPLSAPTFTIPVPPRPPNAPKRPHTASDYRSRRYHKSSLSTHTRSLTADQHNTDSQGDHNTSITNNDGLELVVSDSTKKEDFDIAGDNKLISVRTNPIRSRRVYQTTTNSYRYK